MSWFVPKESYLGREKSPHDEEAGDPQEVRADRAVQLLQRAVRRLPPQPCREHWGLRRGRVPGVHR